MALKSWIQSANSANTDFPLQNLPYGVFRHKGRKGIGVAIGDQVLDLGACIEQKLLNQLPAQAREACLQECLNALMSLGPQVWSELRSAITALLTDDLDRQTQDRVHPHLIPF